VNVAPTLSKFKSVLGRSVRSRLVDGVVAVGCEIVHQGGMFVADEIPDRTAEVSGVGCVDVVDFAVDDPAGVEKGNDQGGVRGCQHDCACLFGGVLGCLVKADEETLGKYDFISVGQVVDRCLRYWTGWEGVDDAVIGRADRAFVIVQICSRVVLTSTVPIELASERFDGLRIGEAIGMFLNVLFDFLPFP